MTDVKIEDLKIGDKVLWARVLPRYGYYELLELTVIILDETHFTGSDSRTKQSHPFFKKDIETCVFKDLKMAQAYLKEQREKNKNVKVFKE